MTDLNVGNVEDMMGWDTSWAIFRYVKVNFEKNNSDLNGWENSFTERRSKYL